jgi:hypothetical protein
MLFLSSRSDMLMAAVSRSDGKSKQGLKNKEGVLKSKRRSDTKTSIILD